MLDIFTVSFFGHREISHFQETEQKLETLIYDLLKQHEYVDFLVGRNGEFDQMVSSTILRVRKRIGLSNCSLILVLPYETAEFRDNEESFRAYYDEIEVCQSSSQAHYKSAIQIRNKEMVDRSDLVVFCVERKSGGAYQTMRYAEKQNAIWVNISNSNMLC